MVRRTNGAMIGFRPTEDDKAIIAKLKKKLGIQSDSDLIRLSLRCLAEKEKV